jgi:SAM-dependent methyltransferase
VTRAHRLKPLVPDHPFANCSSPPYFYARPRLVRYYFYKRLDDILSLWPPRRDTKDGVSLDVGCFVGALTMSLSDKHRMSIGIDIDLEYLKMANQLCKYEGKSSIHYVLADASHLPFKSECVSTVTGSSIFEHLADIPDPFKEIHRVLMPGGLFFAGLPIEVGFSFFIKQLFFRLIGWSRKDPLSFSSLWATFFYGESHGPKWNSDHLDYNWKRTLRYIKSYFHLERLKFWPLHMLRGLASVYVSIRAYKPSQTDGRIK